MQTVNLFLGFKNFFSRQFDRNMNIFILKLTKYENSKAATLIIKNESIAHASARH